MKKNTQKSRGLSLVLSPEEVRDQLLSKARCAALESASCLIEDEVKRLCGNPFEHKKDILCHRGGHQQGYLQLQGGKYHISKPRVRNGDGEVNLVSYQSLKDGELLDETMLGKMINGVSTRKYEDVIDGYAERFNIKKSSVSRAFSRASKKHLAEINETDLSDKQFVALSLDGIGFASRTVICALGIEKDGTKHVIGLRQGSTENSELVTDLLQSLKERGFNPAADKLLVCIDGSKALKKALKDVFGDMIIIARCYLHKQRNLEAYLPKANHPELRRRMKKLMNLVKYSDAVKELTSLQEWLSTISLEAEASIEEVGQELLTVHKLAMPASLRKSFATTNIIESMFSVVRSKTNRIKNWDAAKNQRLRWTASAIVEHEKQTRKIQGYRQIPLLIENLNALALKKKDGYKAYVSSPS